MHQTAMLNADLFFKTYLNKHKIGGKIIEIGSQNVNGSIKEVCPNNMEYVGVDFVRGKGVDVVLNDPYQLPFENNSIDYCVSSSVFEHSELFWVLYLEILRVLKPDGLFFLNAPSNGKFHRYPVDCWRFYPDSGKALVNWGIRSGYNPVLLESFITLQQASQVWSDFIAVFLKDANHVDKYTERMITKIQNFYNGMTYESKGLSNYTEFTEDLAKLDAINKIAGGQVNSPQLTEKSAKLDAIDKIAGGKVIFKWFK